MIELPCDVLISSILGGYVVELRLDDVQVFYSATSLQQVWRLVKSHLERLEQVREDEPVALVEED